MYLIFKIDYLTFDILGSRIFFVGFGFPLSRVVTRGWTPTAVVFSIFFPLFFLSTCLTSVIGIPGITSSDRAWGSESICCWAGWGLTSSSTSYKGTSSPTPCVARCPGSFWAGCTGTRAWGSVCPLWRFISDVNSSVSYLSLGFSGVDK